MLDQLMSYCLTHFEDEETHMEKFAFPGLQVHRHEHRSLMAQVDSLRERYAKGESQVPMELSILVTRWLKLHIKEHDQVFADFLHHRVPEAF
jgi:hemerythrin-like metal-binding protein